MASWSWFSLQCPFECQGGQCGQRWVMGQCGSSGLPGCPGGTGNRPQHREWTQVPFSSLLPWESSRAWERVKCECAHPGWCCSAVPSSWTAPGTRGWALSLGLKRTVAKPHSAHPLGAMLGFRTQLSQQEQYSPNAFLEWMPFPMLCIPCASIPVHKAVLLGQVSGAATLHQDVTPAWFAGCVTQEHSLSSEGTTCPLNLEPQAPSKSQFLLLCSSV